MTGSLPTDASAADEACGTDAPSEADRRRLLNARRTARTRMAAIDAARDAAVIEAFRTELGAVVRSVSPLLGPMLAGCGLTLDDAVRRIELQPGWPRRPRLSRPKHAHAMSVHAIHHYLAAGYLKREPPQQLNGCEIRRRDGGILVIHVVDHSVELSALIGRVRLQTRFGELRVETLDTLPETILAASVGRLIEEIVDHEAWRGRGWRIARVEEASGFTAQAIVVATGSMKYRMPWAR